MNKVYITIGSLLLVGLIIFGIVNLAQYLSEKAAKRTATESLVGVELDKAANKTENGIFKKASGIQDLDVIDSWGMPLRISFRDAGFHTTVEVRSAGPDKMYFTPDDVAKAKRNVSLRNVVHGVKDGLKKE